MFLRRSMLLVVSTTGWTWNPADKGTGVVLSNNNRTATGSSGNFVSVRGTASRSTGKWYFEAQLGGSTGNGPQIGIGTAAMSLSGAVGTSASGYGYSNSGTVSNNATSAATGWLTFGAGDVIGCAIDFDAHKLWFAVNNSWNGNPVAGTGAVTIAAGTYFPAVYVPSAATLPTWTIPQPQSYLPPSGFNAL